MSPKDDLEARKAEETNEVPRMSRQAVGAPGREPDATQKAKSTSLSEVAAGSTLQPAEERRPAFSVADIMLGKPDSADRIVTRIFAKRSSYAVYTATVVASLAGEQVSQDEEVFVQVSDNEAEATTQLSKLAPLTGMRQKLDYLTRGLVKTRCYHLGQIAWALRLGIEGSRADAEEVLAGAILTATEERARIGRRLYLANALAFSGLAAALLGTIAVVLGRANYGADLVGAAAAGALGALLSIAIAIRSRTVAPDHDVVSNRWDAILRLTMGVLSAAALVLLLTSHLTGTVTIGGIEIGGDSLASSWRAVLVIGFAAGFLERLVPDLLEQRVSERATANEMANTASPG